MGKQVADPPYSRNVLEKKPTPSLEIIYAHDLTNVPGFMSIGLAVHVPPGGATAPHRHGGAAVSAFVIKGETYNKMNNEPTYVLSAGESWYEAPGCHHKISANASETEELEIFANVVIEAKVFKERGLAGIVVLDKGFEDLAPHL